MRNCGHTAPTSRQPFSVSECFQGVPAIPPLTVVARRNIFGRFDYLLSLVNLDFVHRATFRWTGTFPCDGEGFAVC